MSRTMLFLAFALTFVLTSPLLAAEPTAEADSIIGKWWFPEKDGQMEIYRDGKAYFGKVIAYEKPEQLDDKNPDPELRGRPFIGITMLQNFEYDAKKKQWASGTIYDADSGKTYKCTLWFENGDLTRLNARGYIGVSLFGRTEVFPRVEDEEQTAGK